MDILVAMGNDVFSGSNSGTVHKISGDAVTATAEIGNEHDIRDITISEDSVWVLTNRKEIYELDKATMVVKRNTSLTYDAMCCTFVPGTAEIWVGEKQGKIHVLSADTFEQTSEIEIP